MSQTYDQLPTNLPVPQDDGAADHLRGVTLPAIALRATDGTIVHLDAPGPGWTVLYAYPMTGVPGVPLPDGWGDIPGARGCTPQACGFRDHHAELLSLGARVYGLSTQSPAYQHEFAERLHLPFAILSDENFALCDALKLPTFTVNGVPLLKRLTMFVSRFSIEHILYPVFPSNLSAEQTIDWLRANG